MCFLRAFVRKRFPLISSSSDTEIVLKWVYSCVDDSHNVADRWQIDNITDHNYSLACNYDDDYDDDGK